MYCCSMQEIVPLYETQRVQQKSMTPTELARAKPTTTPIQEEVRAGARRFAGWRSVKRCDRFVSLLLV